MTGGALLAARVVLALVFGVAAVAKLRDREGARTAVTEFGAPPRLARVLASAIVAAEIAAAVLLFVTSTASVGAGLALGLLALFSVAVAASLARGRAPECRCFGQIHSEPAGGRMLARNAVLAVLALTVLLAGAGTGTLEALDALGGSEGAVLASLAVTVVLATGAALLLGQVLAGQRRIVARTQELQVRLLGAPETDRAPEGLPVGTPAPSLALIDTAGETVTLDALLESGRPVALVFTDPRCGPCQELLPVVAGWQREIGDRVAVVAVSAGAPHEVRAEEAEHGVARMLVDPEAEAMEAFEARGTPSAVLIGPDGHVASPVAAGRSGIENLIQDASGEVLRVVQVGAA